ncbi:16S rRNA (uracil(1498)-N(3))-methyltransferase [Candidatus Gracilibacteria bacterium]|nr:16S rRNA (uracil(1498)-N(3))-methyltransferase [Candidatus Gracilibacteria bacterium]
MQRIYLQNTKFLNEITLTDKEIYHQLTRVMRARVGQSVVFFDGVQKLDFLYQITGIDKSSVVLSLVNTIQKNTDNGNIILYQAFPNKLSKIEFIVQKCVEIGYHKIVFFDSDNSQKLALTDNKKQRLEKIAVEAVEQCGGNLIPEIQYLETPSTTNLISFEQNNSYNIVCHTDGKDSLSLSKIIFLNYDAVNIFVGPEGGFSQREIQDFLKSKYNLVHFGDRILRCETVSSVIGFYILQT